MSLPLRVAAQVWVFLFLAFLGTEPVLGIPEARWIAIVAYAVPVVVLAAARLTRAVDGLDAAVLGTLVVYAAVCLVSPNRWASIETLGLATAFAALFIVARQASAEMREHVAVAAASAFALVLVVHAVLWIREKVAWVEAGGGMPRLESFDVFAWSSPNAIAVVALISLGILRWMAPGPVRSAITVVTGAAAAITVPLSVGRSGWLGLAVAAAVALALLAPAHRRRAVVIGLAAAAGALAVAVMAVAVVGSQSIFRLLQGRDVVWSEAVATIGSSPLVGVGPGTYPWARLTVDAPYADRLSVRLAHNVPLQTAADGGLVLLVAFTALLAFWALRVWRRRGSWDITSRLTIAVLAGFAAMSLFDDQSHLPAITASVIALAAWISGPAPPVASRAGFVAPVVLGCAAIVALPIVFTTTGARADGRDAADAAAAGDWVAAAEGYGQAAERYPTNAAYRLGTGLSLARLGDTEGAIEAYLAAVSLSPGDPRAYGALAVLQPDRAGESLAMAAERTVTDPQYLVRYGDELLRQGDRAGALVAYGRAVARQGRLYARLRGAIGDDELRGAAEDAMTRSQVTSTTFDAVRWDMALVEGDLPTDAGAPWLAIASAMLGDAEASRAHLEAAVANGPHDPYTYQAILAATRLACVDPAGLPDADSLLRLLVAPPNDDSGLEVAWDQTYREPGLGDYQPLTDPPSLEEWPWPLVGDAATCEQP